MRFRNSLLGLCSLLLVSAAGTAADPHPLRLIPEQANLILRIERPRPLLELTTKLDALREAQRLPFVREQLQAPAFQRFLQLVEYYEHDLGMPWPELLDKLAGKGITIAARAGEDNGPAVFVIEGTDADLMTRFVKLAISVVEQELAREESKEKVEKGNYKGIDGFKLGKDLLFAQLGSTLVISNKKEAMAAALDRHVDPKLKSLKDHGGPDAARKVLPSDCFAWLWLDLEVARKAPNAKTVFELPSNDIIQMVIAGASINAVGRAPFLAAGLFQQDGKINLSVRLPGSGYQGQPEAMALHIPPAGQVGALDLLEPPGVILSHSFYLDPNIFWNKREKLFNAKLAKDFAEGEKQVNPFLVGTTLSKLLAAAGPNHRFVAAYREGTPYKTKPDQVLPAFAVVSSMRDPQFGKSMSGILRAAALLAGSQFKLKLVDETYHNVKLVGYQFPEGVPAPSDPENTRFNFTPCFAIVGNQFLACSRMDFAHDMIDALLKEQESSKRSGSPAALRSRVYSSGGVALLTAFEDQVMGQILLDQAVPPAEAKKQVQQLRTWMERLGQAELRIECLETEYRFTLQWDHQGK